MIRLITRHFGWRAARRQNAADYRVSDIFDKMSNLPTLSEPF